MVKWLKVGGHIFFRESCFHQSGDSKRKVNPTHYREPRFYTKVTASTQVSFLITVSLKSEILLTLQLPTFVCPIYLTEAYL